MVCLKTVKRVDLILSILTTWNEKGGTLKLTEVLRTGIALTVVLVSQVYAYVQRIGMYTLNVCYFLVYYT